MSRRFRRAGLPFVVLVAAVVTTAAAQVGDSAAAAAVVRLLDNQERLAVLSGDRAALERLWSPHLTVNAPTGRVNVGRDAVLSIVQHGGLHYSIFERMTEAVQLIGDVAIVMGSENVRPASDTAKEGLVQRRFTNVWKLEGTTWRMIARHANVIPAR